MLGKGDVLKGVFWHDCLFLSLPKLFHRLSLFTESADWEIFKLWNCCWAAALTLMCSEHCFGHISETQDNTSCYEENELHPSQPQCSHESVKREGQLDVWTTTDKTGFLSLKKTEGKFNQCLLMSKDRCRQSGGSLLARLYGGRRRGNRNSCFRRNSVLEIRKNNFTMQTANHWNNLPREVVKSPLMEIFKI